MQNYLGQLLMFLVTLIGASGWFLSKNAIAEMPSVGFMGLRFLLAAFIFLPFAYRSLYRLTKIQILNASAVGVVLALNLFLWVQGITYSNALGEGAFLVSLSMLIAPLIAWLVFKHRPLPVFWLSMPIALAGLYLLAIGRYGELRFSSGSILFLLSSLSAALYFVLNHQYAKNIPSMPLIVIQFGIVGMLCSGYSLTFEVWRTNISSQTWLWFVASVLIASNLRYFVQTLGQKHCNITTAAIIMVLEPVWTLILSVWIMNEPITILKLLGCLLILCALLSYRLNIVRK
ncbi:DMT family transporter [Testudinibacter sp. TR-2022]|uniref:DMT family transporter n=1 Tax=Testudinibacter sp. TR-2022 TaxID=2585029 RepID=UPI001118DCB1|nr:DMT family transporter [Testudinibacter sp. TR-2022]TNH01839.1 DMT family transporter [Pasteurellaceae bacterium Phil31]TNH09653.1 DMT family transporter [Testudinibacter sp. TR-2022]TNH10024.1 DMT family transporter [Testudinibacter sp. TR-2022]TNH14373.1 DMT family transporter [Testudinibacter sp. TR-2022]TNH18121.1 DMT family transporter [Testudinibacter sp. TR-2022]